MSAPDLRAQDLGHAATGGAGSVVGAGVVVAQPRGRAVPAEPVDLTREVDLTGRSGVHLTYWAKVDGFSGGDTARVDVSTDGGGLWSTVKTYTLADSDDVYRSYDIDLSGFSMTSNFQVRFQTHASANQSKLYVDDVKLIE